MIALNIVAYFGIGCCAAALRAYRDPFLFAQEQADEGTIYCRRRTLFYTESVVFHLLLWPIALPITATVAAMESWRRRGMKALAARTARERQAQVDAAEVERIIAEAKL